MQMPAYFCLFTCLIFSFPEMPPYIFNYPLFSPDTQGFGTSVPSQSSVLHNFPARQTLPVSGPLSAPLCLCTSFLLSSSSHPLPLPRVSGFCSMVPCRPASRSAEISAPKLEQPLRCGCGAAASGRLGKLSPAEHPTPRAPM